VSLLPALRCCHRLTAADGDLTAAAVPGAPQLEWRFYGLAKTPALATTQAGAQAFCQAQGGALITVDTPEKNAYLNSLAPALGRAIIWIGLWSGGPPSTDKAAYRWYSGGAPLGPACYAAFAPGEPNNSGGGEGVCVAHVTWTASWIDAECGPARAFACELPKPGAAVAPEISGPTSSTAAATASAAAAAAAAASPPPPVAASPPRPPGE
jgi:hypothetical protein